MSNLSLIIGNKNYSSWSLRPWIFMKQNNIQFSELMVPLYTPNTDEDLKQYGSDFKVPVLIDDGLNVWDSLAILDYLSETYLEGQGWPEDIKARALARSMSAEMHSSFFHIRNSFPMNCRKTFTDVSVSNETQLEIQRIEAIWEQALSMYGTQEGWLFGQYSIADAMFAPLAIRFSGYNIKLGKVAENYVQHVLANQHLQQWISDGKNEKEVISIAEI